jgi:hypothetical protein
LTDPIIGSAILMGLNFPTKDVRLNVAKSLGANPVPSNKENDKILEDDGGHHFRFEYKKIGSDTTVVLTSAGPDGVFGTEDDLVKTVVVWHDGQ